MTIQETAETIREENIEIEDMVMGHNVNGGNALSVLPQWVINQIQDAAREQYGNFIELYHGSDREISEDIEWNENSSFTDEFDIEFAGEDGYIVVAQIPVERIRFYLEEENEFVVSAGELDCEFYTVAEYFGL